MLILGKRITALLRRSQSKPAVNMIKLGDVTVDFSGYTACDENGKIDITPKELEILKVLIDNKGLVLSRNQILDDVWGYDFSFGSSCNRCQCFFFRINYCDIF